MWPDELYIAQDWWEKDVIALRKPSVRFIRASAPGSPTDTKETPVLLLLNVYTAFMGTMRKTSGIVGIVWHDTHIYHSVLKCVEFSLSWTGSHSQVCKTSISYLYASKCILLND